MASINQNPAATLLPNFRNLGVMLRVLVIVTALTVVAAMLKSTNSSALLEQWVGIAAVVQPIAIISVLMLGAVNSWLHRIEYRSAVVLIVLAELAITLAVLRFGEPILQIGIDSLNDREVVAIVIPERPPHKVLDPLSVNRTELTIHLPD